MDRKLLEALYHLFLDVLITTLVSLDDLLHNVITLLFYLEILLHKDDAMVKALQSSSGDLYGLIITLALHIGSKGIQNRVLVLDLNRRMSHLFAYVA